ncbi:hypothetical protein EGR_10613 [Echinococcus granulosus]|uniref:Uncharacterized protein n=1 Tax=Echinococcus granulosus TaxID=6210 RepID=W6UM15_ECHGR|nr:hypothetical protein EGR_10613 [Echinococcus granulosus]EUB54529.1 hypothetical protein EGR_10613 [Echinococcus granulosus]
MIAVSILHALLWIDDGSEDTAMVAANSLSTAEIAMNINKILFPHFGIINTIDDKIVTSSQCCLHYKL